MCINSVETNKYELLNKIANKNSVVILGSTFMREVPIAELRQSFGIHTDVYNRSLTDLTIAEAKDVVESIMSTMAPKKIAIQLGEVELGCGDVSSESIDEMIKDMKSLVETVRSYDKHCKVVLVSVGGAEYSESKKAFNNALETLAKATKSQFADIVSGSKSSDSEHVNAFMKLKYFLSDDINDALMLCM